MICPACGRKVRTVVPAGGDGSAEVYVRHNDPRTGERCIESRGFVERPEVTFL